MYCDFFGFSEKPFDITPDPKFLYLTPGHREALSALIYGIRERKGFVVIVGEVGTSVALMRKPGWPLFSTRT
jgi:general secretion pathway protein A